MSVAKNKKNFQGLDGFVWWTGIVECRKDPMLLSRVQIRMFGWHTENKELIPTEELLWAHPIFPCNMYNTTYVPKEGEMVFGFFMDGEDAQFPFYMGVIPAIPAEIYPQEKGFSDPGDEEDVAERPIPFHLKKPTRYPNEIDLEEPTTSRTARHDFLMKTPLFDPTYLMGEGTYDAKYPYNWSMQSECGHIFDIDDTKDKERITLMHKSGSFIEFTAEGDILIKSKRFIRLNCIGPATANLKSSFHDGLTPLDTGD